MAENNKIHIHKSRISLPTLNSSVWVFLRIKINFKHTWLFQVSQVWVCHPENIKTNTSFKGSSTKKKAEI